MPKRQPKNHEMDKKFNQNQWKGEGEERRRKEAGQRQLGGGLINLKGWDLLGHGSESPD